MLNKIFTAAMVAVLTALLMPSRVDAWGAARVSATRVGGYGGGYRAGYAGGVGYGGYGGGYRYNYGYGGGARYGSYGYIR